MDIMGLEWMSFHTAREEECQMSTDSPILGKEPHDTLTNTIVSPMLTNNKMNNLPNLMNHPSKQPNKSFFIDALQDEDECEDPLLFVDAKDQMKPKEQLGKAFHMWAQC